MKIPHMLVTCDSRRPLTPRIEEIISSTLNGELRWKGGAARGYRCSFRLGEDGVDLLIDGDPEPHAIEADADSVRRLGEAVEQARREADLEPGTIDGTIARAIEATAAGRLHWRRSDDGLLAAEVDGAVVTVARGTRGMASVLVLRDGKPFARLGTRKAGWLAHYARKSLDKGGTAR